MDILIPDTSSLINIHEVYAGGTHITAELALRQVNPHLAGTQSEMMKRLREHRRYLEQLHALLKTLPVVRKMR